MSQAVPFHWVKLGHVTAACCKGGREMLPSYVPRKKATDSLREELVSKASPQTSGLSEQHYFSQNLVTSVCFHPTYFMLSSILGN